ncbi:MAG: hypothetical protein ABL974_07430 [Prosthecobacter sp.]
MRSLLPSLIALLLSTHLSVAEEKTAFASFIELPWSYVIGGHAEGKWLTSEAAGKRLSAPVTTYRVFTLTGETGKVTGAKAAPDGDLCPDMWRHKLTTEIEPDTRKNAIGVNAAWEPMPRQSKSSSLTQEIYVQAMKAVLSGRGIERPEVKLTQLLRVDLDGDGTDEVLTSATHYLASDVPSAPREGDYSVVTLRSVIGIKVQTQLVSGEVYAKADLNAAPNTYEIAGLLDLNGDGTLEVLIRTSYYEGGGMQVWQLQKGVLVQVLSIECGA